MTEAKAHITNTVDENTTELFPTAKQLGINASFVPNQPQGSEETPNDNSNAYIVLRSVLYSLERNCDEAEDTETDGIQRINDGDDIWEKVLQLKRLLTLPPTNPDYTQPTRLIKGIHKGEINKVLGSEILAEEKEIVLSCILSISLCCGEAALGAQWQLIALRLISFLPIRYINFFLHKMELHLKNINADILKALIDRCKTDSNFVNLLNEIFTRQEKITNEPSNKDILAILTSSTENDAIIEDLNNEKSLPEKVRIVILNEMIAKINQTLTQKERAEIMAVIMNKADNGTKISQYLSSGIELNPNYVIIINEQMRKLGLPEIQCITKNGKPTYKKENA